MFVCSGISMHTFQLPPFSLWNATRSQRSTNVEMFGEYRWNKASSYSVTCVIFKDFMFLSLEIMVEVHYLVACCSISDCLSRECFGFCSGDRRSVGVHTESAPRVSWLDSVWDSLYFSPHIAFSLDHKSCETRYEVAWLILDPCLDFITMDHDNSWHMMSTFAFRCIWSETSHNLKTRLQHGSPITRRRVFIILVRRELMLENAKKDFQEFCDKIKEMMRTSCEIHWSLGSVHSSEFSCWGWRHTVTRRKSK